MRFASYVLTFMAGAVAMLALMIIDGVWGPITLRRKGGVP